MPHACILPTDDPHHWIHAADGAARATARRRRLPPTDMEELRSELWLKILRRDREMLKKFDGRGSLHAFLQTVADRCLLDQRVRIMGKWRPSQTARRLGPAGVALDRLTRRDGFSMDQAVETLRGGASAPTEDIRAASQLLRGVNARPSRRTVPLDDAIHLPARTPCAESSLDGARTMRNSVRVRATLARCLEDLRPEDQRLLRRRFAEGASVADIARADGSDQKTLYRRLQGVLTQLRDRLQQSGVSAADALPLLGNSGSPLDGLLQGLAGDPDGLRLQN